MRARNDLILVLCVSLLTACGIDDGEVFVGCQSDCGPGALRSGRFIVDESGSQAGSSNGKLARTVIDELAWLADDFTTTDTTSFDNVANTSDGRISNLTITEAGGAYLIYSSDDGDDTYRSLIAVGADHKQTWRHDVSDFGVRPSITGDDQLALVTGDSFFSFKLAGQTVDESTIVALHAEDGTLAWVKQGVPFDEIAKASNGSVFIAGRFSGTLTLGGAVGPLVATGSTDSYVAALDPTTGECTWVTQIRGATRTGSTVHKLAIGPAGEIALSFSWDVGAVSLDGRLLAGDQYSTPAVALLDPSGRLRWAQKTTWSLAGMLTDGERVIATSPDYFAQLSSTGVDWTREVSGKGSRSVNVLALAGDRLLMSISATGNYTGHPFTAVTTVGDVSIEGNGLILADVVR